VEAGQSLIPFVAKDQILTPAMNNRQITLKSATPLGDQLQSGYALLPSAHQRRFLTLIVAA
jgi:hypothetical protein